MTEVGMFQELNEQLQLKLQQVEAQKERAVAAEAQRAASALAAGLATPVQTVLQRGQGAKRCTMSTLAPDI